MKSVLITGASSGIGRAVAKGFAKLGWRVGAIARRADKLHALSDAHPNVVALPGLIASVLVPNCVNWSTT